MTLDSFVALLSDTAWKLVPVAAVILLIYLIVFVHRLLGVLKNVNGTLKTVDQDLQKLIGRRFLQPFPEYAKGIGLVYHFI